MQSRGQTPAGTRTSRSSVSPDFGSTTRLTPPVATARWASILEKPTFGATQPTTSRKTRPTRAAATASIRISVGISNQKSSPKTSAVYTENYPDTMYRPTGSRPLENQPNGLTAAQLRSHDLSGDGLARMSALRSTPPRTRLLAGWVRHASPRSFAHPTRTLGLPSLCAGHRLATRSRAAWNTGFACDRADAHIRWATAAPGPCRGGVLRWRSRRQPSVNCW